MGERLDRIRRDMDRPLGAVETVWLRRCAVVVLTVPVALTLTAAFVVLSVRESVVVFRKGWLALW